MTPSFHPVGRIPSTLCVLMARATLDERTVYTTSRFTSQRLFAGSIITHILAASPFAEVSLERIWVLGVEFLIHLVDALASFQQHAGEIMIVKRKPHEPPRFVQPSARLLASQTMNAINDIVAISNTPKISKQVTNSSPQAFVPSQARQASHTEMAGWLSALRHLYAR